MNRIFKQLSIPYEEYLSNFEWEMWGTLTTPYTMSLSSTERAMTRFEKNINKEFPQFRVFWAAERFAIRGYHVHLIGTFDNATMTFTQKSIIIGKCWEKAVAGHRRPCNKIKKYKKNKNAIRYMLKDMLTRRFGYGFMGDLWAVTKKQ
jgi:hypothetical protein